MAPGWECPVAVGHVCARRAAEPERQGLMQEEEMRREVAVESTAEAYLELLAARGIDYFFAKGGTDFGPIVEAFAKRLQSELPVPRPATVQRPIAEHGLGAGVSGLWRLCERVEDPAEVPGALERALRVVQQEHRQALLNMASV